MPCSDSASWAEAMLPKEPDLSKKIAFLEAALCAVLTVVDNLATNVRVYEYIKFSEAGISEQELMDWWEEHKKKDAIRREKEAAKKQNLKENALRKLSQEEREALGL